MIPVRPGLKYRFIYTLDNGKTHYSSIGKLMDVSGTAYLLNLRPLAGTAKLDKRFVVRIEAVPADTQPLANQRWRGVTR